VILSVLLLLHLSDVLKPGTFIQRNKTNLLFSFKTTQCFTLKLCHVLYSLCLIIRRQGKITTNKATKSFDTVVNLVHFGSKLKSNFTHAENERKLDSGNPSYHSVQNTLSSLLTESMKIKIYKIINAILPAALYGCENGLLHWWMNTVWGCLRTYECWRGIFKP